MCRIGPLRHSLVSATIIRSLDHARTLARARRCVSECAQRLTAQQKRVIRLRVSGGYAGDAERLLQTFEDSQLAAIHHFAWLEKRRRG
jgi:hypothetical protein